MSETELSKPRLARPFRYSFGITFTCLAANAVLTLSEIVLHTFFLQKLDRWLAFSHDVMYSIGKFVPAVFYVGRQMTMNGYYPRMEFVENVIALNFLICATCGILSSAAAMIEIVKNKDEVVKIAKVILLNARKYTFASKNVVIASMISLCFFLFMLVTMYRGWVFATPPFPAYVNNIGILLILIYFAFVEIVYVPLVLLLAAAIFSLSGPGGARTHR
jgi:hypothetical protein